MKEKIFIDNFFLSIYKIPKMFRTAKRERTPIISATLVTIGITTLSGSMLNL